MSEAIIKLINVNKSFGPIDVLHDINIELRAGKVQSALSRNFNPQHVWRSHYG